MAHYRQEDEETRLRRRLSEKAVDLAVQGRWEEAEMVNRNIIERFPSDIEAYNRLGKALTELGDFAQAKQAYLKVLTLAPSNAIANKNLARLANLPEFMDDKHRKILSSRARVQKVAPEFFTTEMGKSGITNLCNLVSGEVLAKMALGDEVQLRVKGQRLIVESVYGEYLGEVEPKHALRLIRLMKSGNEYAAAILNVRLPDEVHVVIKEVRQHPSQVGHIAFPVQVAEHLRSYARESFLGRKLAIDGAEAKGEFESPEEEAEYSRSEGESLPEGFSIFDDAGRERELEA
ncbi:MAG: tetratricopeptide repeat protein [Dehalococcoidia bacterium]|nr:tetratricopeptide repeat protein [Dehalococcoidia bacterium]